MCYISCVTQEHVSISYMCCIVGETRTLPLTAASLRLRVHQQTSQNVHGHERERRPQQQVQQLYQDAGDGGGPGDQFPDLRVTGQ